MTRKLTFDFVCKYFKEHECELLETEYVNWETKMKYKCKCGNISEITWSSFKKGQRCRICYINTRKENIQYIKEFFKQQNCELLETEYVNCDNKMKYKCKCGGISEITWYNFKNGSRCMKCCNSEKALKYEDVYIFFKEQNCELLESDYINSSTKMKYRCKCGNISTIIWNSFKNGNRCKECSNELHRLNFEDIYNFFKKQKCELLESEYINCKTKMKYKCECKNISKITWNNFNKGVRCSKCKNKTESIVLKFLMENYTDVIAEAKFEWCKNKKYLPFDFLINKNILLEVDGIQHFKQVSNWRSPEESHRIDVFKMKNALNNNYRIIRIFQEDILLSNTFWKNDLISSIEQNTNKLIFLSSNINLYDNIISEFPDVNT